MTLGRASQLYYNTGAVKGCCTRSLRDFQCRVSCFHCTVSGASKSPFFSLRCHCPWLLCPYAAAHALCCQKCWFGLQWRQQLCSESPGCLLLRAPRGRYSLAHARALPALSSAFVPTHSHSHSLPDFPVKYSVDTLQDQPRSGSKWT